MDKVPGQLAYESTRHDPLLEDDPWEALNDDDKGHWATVEATIYEDAVQAVVEAWEPHRRMTLAEVVRAIHARYKMGEDA